MNNSEILKEKRGINNAVSNQSILSAVIDENDSWQKILSLSIYIGDNIIFSPRNPFTKVKEGLKDVAIDLSETYNSYRFVNLLDILTGIFNLVNKYCTFLSLA